LYRTLIHKWHTAKSEYAPAKYKNICSFYGE
jgi:hypothetical protein